MCERDFLISDLGATLFEAGKKTRSDFQNRKVPWSKKIVLIDDFEVKKYFGVKKLCFIVDFGVEKVSRSKTVRPIYDFRAGKYFGARNFL